MRVAFAIIAGVIRASAFGSFQFLSRDGAFAESVLNTSSQLAISDTVDSSKHIKIKAFFVNMADSKDRAKCMNKQLEMIAKQALKQYNAQLDYDRWDAVAFDTCHDVPSCKKEKPKCFPNPKHEYMFHGTLAENDKAGIARAVRGILGNWCAHKNLLEAMHNNDISGYDYYMVFEDDCIFTQEFPNALFSFLRRYPRHWSLVAMDTFTNDERYNGGPKQDIFDHIGSYPLHSMSQSQNTYWGAHAWLINGDLVGRYSKLYCYGPAIAVDMISKVQMPPDVAMWAYQTGTVDQEKTVGSDNGMAKAACAAVTGSDINGNGQSDLEIGMASELDDIVAMTKSAESIVVLGMPHSGVPLATEIINSHLGPIAKWSMAHPNRLKHIKSMPKGDNTLAVVVVRHPFAVMERFKALSRAKDGMNCNNGGKGAAWVKGGCTYRALSAKSLSATPGALPDLADSHCPEPIPKGNKCWSSIPSIWSNYLKGYKAIKNRFSKMIIVRYEDIYANPAGQLKMVAALAHHAPPKSKAGTPVVKSPPPSDRYTVDPNPSMENYDFGAHFSCDAIKVACGLLDKHELWRTGYVGCQKEWLGYRKMIYEGVFLTPQNTTKYATRIQCNP